MKENDKHSRRNFLKLGGLSFLASLPTLSCFSIGNSSKNDRSNKRPNILLIVADDMGYGDVGCYNSDSKIPTPNMDRLAKQGIRFTDAHSPSAVCSPTRYGVLTGRYCWRTWLKRYALIGYSPPLIEPGQMTVGTLLRQHGYETACIGKWHVGMRWTLKPGSDIDFHRPLHWPREFVERIEKTIDFSKPIVDGPINHGFDYFFGTAGCSTTDPPHVFIENDHTVGVPSVLSSEEMHCDLGLMVPGWVQEDVDPTFTKKSIEFIERHVKNKPNGPFFLYLALSAPHAPHLPPEFVKGHSNAGLRGDQVVLVDWSVGQILDALDRLRLGDNTLVIVSSDNGPLPGVRGHKSAGDWRGHKSHIWEGGHRVPFIARWPAKIKPGTTSKEVICLTDLMATCAAVVGTELPANAGQDSYNVLPALLCERLDKPVRDAIVHHSVWGGFAIRQGPWKLILGTQGSGGWVEPEDEFPKQDVPGQLYNIERDPREEENLWDKRPDLVQRLTRLLEKYRQHGYSELFDLEKDTREMNDVCNDPAYAKVVKELKRELKHLKSDLGDTDDRI